MPIVKGEGVEVSARILVVDDDEGVQKFVSAILRGNRYDVLKAVNGLDALKLAREYRPNIILLDLSLPGMQGLDLCRELRTWYFSPILVLSGNGEEATIVRALDLGADDYITKPFRSRELLARIRALLRRAAPGRERPATLEARGLTIDFAKRRVIRDGEVIRLTRTEFEILSFLARNANRVATSEMILREVWGPHHGEYAQTLRVHVGHIRKKIEPEPSSPTFIVTEPGVGYRFNAEADLDDAEASAASN